MDGVMGSGGTRVDFAPVEDFRDRAAPRAQQVVAALNAIAHSQWPALGHFHDARQTAERYDALRADYLVRLRRLLWTLLAARAATTSILATYQTGEEVSLATLKAAASLPRPGETVIR